MFLVGGLKTQPLPAEILNYCTGRHITLQVDVVLNLNLPLRVQKLVTTELAFQLRFDHRFFKRRGCPCSNIDDRLHDRRARKMLKRLLNINQLLCHQCHHEPLFLQLRLTHAVNFRTAVSSGDPVERERRCLPLASASEGERKDSRTKTGIGDGPVIPVIPLPPQIRTRTVTAQLPDLRRRPLATDTSRPSARLKDRRFNAGREDAWSDGPGGDLAV